MMDPLILTLDIATRTGWAVDSVQLGRPQCGTYRLPTRLGPSDLGARMQAFANWLHGMILRYNPQVVGIEQPMPPKWTPDSFASSRLSISLSAMAHYIAVSDRVPEVVERTANQHKRHFAGTDRGGKEPVMARCRQLGWVVGNDNEADAAALWALLKCERDPSFSYSTTPLGAAAGM